MKTKKVVKVASITNIEEFHVATLSVAKWRIEKIYLDDNSSAIMGIKDKFEDIQDKYLKKEVKVKVVSDKGEERVLTVNAKWDMTGYAFSQTNDFDEVKIKDVQKVEEKLKDKEEFKEKYVDIENITNIDDVVNKVVKDKAYEGCMTEAVEKGVCNKIIKDVSEMY